MKHYGTGSYHLRDKDGKKYLLTVEYDEYPQDPRDWSNVATIWCWHRNYIIGDKVPNNMNASEALEYLCEKYEIEYDSYEDDNMELFRKLAEHKDIVVMPINCYEHSMITISTSSGYPYNDPWDAGMIGFAFIDKETAMKNFMSQKLEDWKERAEKCIYDEVEVLDQYLRGDVYRYTLEEQVHIHNEKKCPHCGEVIEVTDFDDWEEVDSCCGFYGSYLEENGILDCLPSDIELLYETTV